MPRLVAIAFSQSPRLPGLHSALSTTFEVGPKAGPLKDWRVAVGATSLFFISPPGWRAGAGRFGAPMSAESLDVTTYEVSRSIASLQWSYDEGEAWVEPIAWIQSAAAVAMKAAPVLEQPAEPTPTDDDDSDLDEVPVVVKRGPGRPRKVQP